MGRKITIGDNSSFDPAFSFPFLFLLVSMVATLAIITGLCGTRFRKKSSPPPPSSPDNTTDTPQIAQPSTTLTEIDTQMVSEEKVEDKIETPEIQQPLKLPPQRMLNQSSSYSCHNKSNSVSGTGLLNLSMSLKVPRSMSVMKSRSKREEKTYKKKDNFKGDAVWMKTIILGEKCRVPDNEDDPVVYDDKGNIISNFHAKNPSSLPPSRTCSIIDPQAIPG